MAPLALRAESDRPPSPRSDPSIGIEQWLPLEKLTPHLDIRTDLEPEELEFYARFFEGFIDYFQRNYFEFDQPRRLNVYLFATEDRFEQFTGRFGLHESPFGYYFGPPVMTVMLNVQRGIGAATHEMVHHFVSMGFPSGCPLWVNEGFAMFFEKFIAHFDDSGRLDISFGYFNDWRFAIALEMLNQTTLDDILTYRQPNAVETFMLFLHRRQLLKLFINDLRRSPGDRLGMASLVAIYGASPKIILKDWQAWMEAQPLDENMHLLPWALVLSNEDWKAWWKEHQDHLYWDDDLKIYRAKMSDRSRTAG